MNFGKLTLLIGPMFLAAACGTIRVQVQSAAPSPIPRAADASTMRLALRIDPDLARQRIRATTHPGFGAGPGYIGTIDVEADVGQALADTILETFRSRFTEVQPTETDACPAGADGVVSVGLAKQPAMLVRWAEHFASEGGGATVELATKLTARRCDGAVVWRGVAVGFGSEDRTGGFLLNMPGEEEFRPGVNAALQDLARNLTATLAKVNFAQLFSMSEEVQ
jgi:hypothetical protein